MMINYLIEARIPFFVTATKCDKLSPTALEKTLEEWKNTVFRNTGITVVPYSVVTGEGKDKVWSEIFSRIH